ncbi:hypothetical protein P280DRAFT_466369 [Massarina eburnea CBS 473.64]|uniref:Uncharacterized protein n=1 Tax=Massarina eburnea CBS 473.64 TaxID=1395130 RepID=A0A6A6SFE0_9PLEO|nr:hypothetical protein P280DRAFT_466369 [Massarina eburnea CBS 473.64]
MKIARKPEAPRQTHAHAATVHLSHYSQFQPAGEDAGDAGRDSRHPPTYTPHFKPIPRPPSFPAYYDGSSRDKNGIGNGRTASHLHPRPFSVCETR